MQMLRNRCARRSFMAATAILLITSSAPLAAREVPFLSGRVVDETGTLNAKLSAEIETRLADHEKATGNQVVVCIIDSLEGEVLEEFSLRTAESYKLGQADRDNGVLLLIAKADRKLRIEVGYGLEGALTDALSARIIRNEIVPLFRDGEFDAGVAAGVDAILAAIAGEYQVESAEAPDEATLGDTIGEWISKIFTFLLGGGFLLYAAFMGIGFLMALFRHGLFAESWLWFLFMGPLMALMMMIPLALVWNDPPGLVLLGVNFALLFAFRLWMHLTKPGQKLRERFEPDESSGGSASSYLSGNSFSSSSSSSSSFSSSSSGGFSGGGGSFGGGGSSGSW